MSEITGIRNKHKETLPAICYNANFNRYKDLDHLIAPTNLMFLDIDDFQSREEALDYKSYITLQYDWIIACSLSLSRMGLHVIILVDKIRNNDDYNTKYDYISTEYFNGKLDTNSKSLTRYTVIPFDYNIYINECPNVLNIDHIIQSEEKGIRSGHKKEEVISTAYTFTPSTLNPILNDSARKDNLIFRQSLDESLYTDPDIPIYFPEGRDVIKINLRPFHDRKVKEGHRTFTIGGLSVKLIYLNARLPQTKDSKVRDAILKCLVGINKEICDPPLTYKEVRNSFNANWRKYEADELDFSRYFEKQRSFWSKDCTLKGNEKRKVTCRIKNEPVIAETKRKIKSAIAIITSTDEKVTQKNVAIVSGLTLPTVKKYRKYYREVLHESNSADIDNNSVDNKPNLVEHTSTPMSKLQSFDESISRVFDQTFKIADPENLNDIEDIEDMTSKPQSLNPGKESTLTDDQLRMVFERVFQYFIPKIGCDEEKVLFERFSESLGNLPKDELSLLAKPIESIRDSDTFFKQVALDSRFWNLLQTS